MGIDAGQVQRWLDAYTGAWLTYDPGAIGALFTDDAEYRWHPWDEGGAVARGREAIVAAWLENRDAVGMSFYYTDDTQATLDRAYHNLWVLRFGDEGRCREFTEWYMQAPGAP